MNIFRKDEIDEIDIKIINQIRGLAVDMINNFGKGSDGLALSAAPTFYTLFTRHLNIIANDPKYINRDRLLIGNSMFSPLLYSCLYMAGYDYTEEDLKNYGLNESKTKFDCKIDLPNGIEISSSYSSKVFATSLGYAIAEEYLRNYFKSKNINLIDYFTYVIVSESDLSEGLFNETLSLAGELKLNKLITICNLTKNSDINLNDYFKSMNWNLIEVNNGEDVISIDKAIENAKNSDKPTMIIIKTTLGKFSNYEGKEEIRNHILTSEDISNIKNKLDLRDISFAISSELKEEFQNQINSRVVDDYNKFEEEIKNIDDKYFDKLLNFNLKINLGELETVFEEDTIKKYGHNVINTITNDLFMSISCDDFTYCDNYLDDKGDFSIQNRLGNNLNVGNRKELAGYISTGLTLSGIRNINYININSSFNLLPAIKFAADMNLNNIYVLIESENKFDALDIYRNIDNVEMYRPNDINEVIGTFKFVLSKIEGVSVIVLSDKKTAIEDSTSINDTNLGGYIVKEEEGIPFINLISSGKDLDIAFDLEKRLVTKGIFTRVISMPSINRFSLQENDYKNKIIDINEKTYVIESSKGYNYFKYTNNYENILNINDYENIDSLENKIESLL